MTRHTKKIFFIIGSFIKRYCWNHVHPSMMVTAKSSSFGSESTAIGGSPRDSIKATNTPFGWTESSFYPRRISERTFPGTGIQNILVSFQSEGDHCRIPQYRPCVCLHCDRSKACFFQFRTYCQQLVECFPGFSNTVFFKHIFIVKEILSIVLPCYEI